MQCRQRKCLCTKWTSSTTEFEKPVKVFPTTPELHVRAFPQRPSQGTATNDTCKQIVGAAVIYSVAAWRFRYLRVWYLMHHSRQSSEMGKVFSYCAHLQLLRVRGKPLKDTSNASGVTVKPGSIVIAHALSRSTKTIAPRLDPWRVLAQV